MKCHHCNRTVTRKSKFCPNCGEPVAPRTRAETESARSQLPLGWAIALLGVGIVIGIAVVKFGGDASEAPPVVAPLSSTDALGWHSPAVQDIAREFQCFCGTCEDRLDVCDCDHPKGAVEVKSFIAQKLREGHKKPHIVEMVQEAYGKL